MQQLTLMVRVNTRESRDILEDLNKQAANYSRPPARTMEVPRNQHPRQLLVTLSCWARRFSGLVTWTAVRKVGFPLGQPEGRWCPEADRPILLRELWQKAGWL